MDIILLEPMRVGNRNRSLGDLVSVKAGFARNYLIPYGKAVAATKQNVAEFETRRKDLEAKAQGILDAANQRAEKLQELTLTISANASEEGKLFGSVGTQEICQALEQQGHDIEKREIVLPEGAMHEIGEFSVHLHLHPEVNVEIKINIIAAK